VLLRDITEVSRLEAQLRRSDKLAALGTLSAGVATRCGTRSTPWASTSICSRPTRARPFDGNAVRSYLDVLRSVLQRLDRGPRHAT